MANPYKSAAIPKPIIVRAIEMNENMKQAAASIHVSYNTFRKYAVMYDIWAPMTDIREIGRSRNRPRLKHWDGKDQLGLDKHKELQRKLITEGLKKQRCDYCGHDEYRKSDMLSPLMIWFDNQDENDHTPSNVKFYCYNDYFILYDEKFKPKKKKLSAYKKGAEPDNRFTRQLNKTVKDAKPDAKQLGADIAAIFTSK